MRIKILHILHSLQVGGLENGVVNIINSLDPDRFEHVICCINTSGPMSNRIQRPVQIYSLGKGEKKDYLLSLKIARVIRKVNPDMVHTRNWGTIDGVIASRFAGVKRIIHGEHGREATDPVGTNARRNVARRCLSPLVSRFVAVSEDLRNWLIREAGIPERKVIQIINGVDTGRFKPAEDKVQAKARQGFPPSSFLIGSVGRLDPVKNYPTLIRAFASFATDKTSSTGKTDRTFLVITGSGPEEQSLKKEAEDLGVIDNVYFLGERKDIPNLLQCMDVYVLPSVAEGISNTILEAMASGLPVVATRVGGNPELIEEGKTGFLFNPGDHNELAEKLFLYHSNRSLTMAHGSRGRERTERRFSLAKMIGEYERLYLTVAGD